MEHKFGVFETVEELNRAAAAQKAEGDTEAVLSLARENGIDPEDAQDYLDGAADVLATPLMAAVGKLEMEGKELGLKSQLEDWREYIASLCAEDEALCLGVFRPDRHLEDVLAAGLRSASTNRVPVPAGIARKAGLPARTDIGMTGRDELRRIARQYYVQGVKVI